MQQVKVYQWQVMGHGSGARFGQKLHFSSKSFWNLTNYFKEFWRHRQVIMTYGQYNLTRLRCRICILGDNVPPEEKYFWPGGRLDLGGFSLWGPIFIESSYLTISLTVFRTHFWPTPTSYWQTWTFQEKLYNIQRQIPAAGRNSAKKVC